MVPGFLIRGIIIGFSIAAPVGPIGVLCIRRALAHGRAAGFVSGLGAATADAFYGAVAAFGISAVSAFLLEGRHWLRLVGGAFLCYLGIRTFLARPAGPTGPGSATSLAGAYLSTLFLTLTNPMTILSFAAVFAGLGLGGAGRDYAAAGVMVLGVFSGSALWWLTLALGVGTLRARLGPPLLVWANRLSGSVIAAFGVAALLGLLE